MKIIFLIAKGASVESREGGRLTSEVSWSLGMDEGAAGVFRPAWLTFIKGRNGALFLIWRCRIFIILLYNKNLTVKHRKPNKSYFRVMTQTVRIFKSSTLQIIYTK